MNFDILFTFAIFVIISFVVSEQLRKPSHGVSKKCTRELEAIVYQPVTYDREYLDRISLEFKIAGPVVLWTNQAESFIVTFEQKYQVSVTIRDPFRKIVYPFTKGILLQSSYFSTTSTANMNGSGYSLNTKTGLEAAWLEFIVFNPNGELKYVMISLPLSRLG